MGEAAAASQTKPATRPGVSSKIRPNSQAPPATPTRKWPIDEEQAATLAPFALRPEVRRKIRDELFVLGC